MKIHYVYIIKYTQKKGLPPIARRQSLFDKRTYERSAISYQ
jgi:hypothetical protein